MKRTLLAVFLVGMLAAGLFFGLASVVSAQDDAPATPPAPGYERRGMTDDVRGTGQKGLMNETMEAAMAEKLGLSVEALAERRSQGLTFWQIAEEMGFNLRDVQQMKLDARSAAVDRLVQDGVLTQEQAQTMRERWSQMMENGVCGGNGNGAGRGSGMMGGGGGGGGGGRWSRGNQ